MHFRIASPVLILLAAAAAAADRFDPDDDGLTPNDLRLGCWLMPLDMNVDTQSGGAANYHKQGLFASGRRLSLQWVPPLAELSDEGGCLLGFELSSTTYRQEQSLSDPEITLHAYALTLHPGLAWRLGGQVHLELGPFLGYGTSSVSPGSGSGRFWEFGVRLAGYWTLARHLQLGIDGRYLGTNSRQDFTYGATDEEVLIKTKGGSIGAQLGYRF